MKHKQLFLTIILIDFLFIALHWLTADRLFDLDQEGNIPTLFQAGQLVVVGLLNLLLLRAGTPRLRLEGLMMGIIFLFLAADEWFEIHENLASAFREWSAANLQLEFNFAEWLILYIPLMLIAGGVFWYMWRKLRVVPKSGQTAQKTKVQISSLFLLGGICFALVPVLELIGTWDWQFDSPHYQLAVSIEEGLEMVGASAFVVFSYMRQQKLNTPSA